MKLIVNAPLRAWNDPTNIVVSIVIPEADALRRLGIEPVPPEVRRAVTGSRILIRTLMALLLFVSLASLAQPTPDPRLEIDEIQDVRNDPSNAPQKQKQSAAHCDHSNVFSVYGFVRSLSLDLTDRREPGPEGQRYVNQYRAAYEAENDHAKVAWIHVCPLCEGSLRIY